MPTSSQLPPALRASVATLTTRVKVGEPTAGHTGAVVKRVSGAFETTVTLLEYGDRRVCLVASHLGTASDDASAVIQRTAADALGLSSSDVLSFSSHNHSAPQLEKKALTSYEETPKKSDLTPLGKAFMRELHAACKTLPARLEPVTVWYGEGREGRITYNRKAHRADGASYFMREEDRVLVGEDYRGDIDEQAPVVCLKRVDGSPLTFLVQFNGHPVTIYHPENFTASGDWPQFACNILSASVPGRRVPVSFMQGCAGDISSKKMFSGDIALAKRYGRYLGEAYVKASRKLKRSTRTGFDFAIGKAKLPLGALPSPAVLQRELTEMEDFMRRADAGDQDTLTCVGLNFPRAMTPAYRGKLVAYVMPWNRWGLELHRRGKAKSVPKHFDIDVYVLRLGDVGIVGLPCEPFLGIARQIRSASPLPLAIPCGYCNLATGYIGYVPDGSNVGGGEYMSAFHRYTRFLPAFRAPAGDVMAQAAVRCLIRMA